MAECNHSVQEVPLLSKGLAFAGFWTLRFGFENKACIAPKYPIHLRNNKHVKNTIQWKAAGRSQQRKTTSPKVILHVCHLNSGTVTRNSKQPLFSV